MGTRRRSKRRRGASAGGADRISGLGDDVLLRILELLPDACDVVRTDALSRRWRGLWRRVNSLTFDDSNGHRIDQRFLDFVNGALAQRATADAALGLEHLAISFAIMSLRDDVATRPLVRRSTDAAREWIRYAVQKAVKSFVLELELSPIRRSDDRPEVRCDIWEKQPLINLNDLPGSAKLETMHWQMNGVRLQLPAAAVFASLVDLSLEDIKLTAGSAQLLARLLSAACCPSLQKLRLIKLDLPELNELLIEAGALLELLILTWPNAGTALKLETPSLRILHLEDYDEYLGTGIFAPKLEEVTFLPHQPHHIDIDSDLPCVKSLKVRLDSHGDEDDDINNGGICLLRSCTSLTCLEVSLEIPLDMPLLLVADIISGRIPHLPYLISLTVHVVSSDLHSFGVGLSEILKQCSYLKYLSVHYFIDTPEQIDDEDFLCEHPDHNESHQVCLANIEEVRFTGLAGTDCERSFIQGVLEHATHLQKVALSFDPEFRLHNRMDCTSFITCDGGTWVRDDPSLSYEWKSD